MSVLLSVAIVCMVNNTAIKQATLARQHHVTDVVNISSKSAQLEDQCYFKEAAKGESFDVGFHLTLYIQIPYFI